MYIADYLETKISAAIEAVKTCQGLYFVLP